MFLPPEKSGIQDGEGQRVVAEEPWTCEQDGKYHARSVTLDGTGDLFTNSGNEGKRAGGDGIRRLLPAHSRMRKNAWRGDDPAQSAIGTS